MATKRMFALAVIDTDAFLGLPVHVQALYFHLGLHGDDDGIVANPKTIMRSIGCNVDDLKQLEDTGFIYIFDSGVVAIRDWKINNELKNDRYHPTLYQAEILKLVTDETKRYTLWNQIGTTLEPK